jgi:uncharacterized protein
VRRIFQESRHFFGDRLQADEVVDDADLLPIVPYIARDVKGEPGLFGRKCSACGEIALGSPTVCARCGTRDDAIPVTLANTGKLYVWTTVHRSLPGIATPFVFAIVDLDGGGVVKGNLIAPECDIRFDMPVKVVFGKAGQVDARGRSYLTYHFAKA